MEKAKESNARLVCPQSTSIGTVGTFSIIIEDYGTGLEIYAYSESTGILLRGELRN